MKNSSSFALELQQGRVDLAAALRLAAKFDLHEGIDNHFSLMLSDGSFLVNRWGIHWSRITALDILQVDADGRVLSGAGQVERTALVIHSQVHLLCPDARAILHTHMPHATALACTRGRISYISQNSLRFYDRIHYDEVYCGIANDLEEGRRLAAAVRICPIVLMQHHGVIVTAPTVGLAFDDLYFLERTARVQLLAEASAAEFVLIDDAVAREAALQLRQLDADRETHFRALKELLEVEEPHYARAGIQGARLDVSEPANAP